MIETAWPYLAVTARRWGRTVAWHVRDWAAMLVILLLSAMAGLFTWAVSSSGPGNALPCGTGYVTATCPFHDPAVDREYLGDRITSQAGRLVIHTRSGVPYRPAAKPVLDRR